MIDAPSPFRGAFLDGIRRFKRDRVGGVATLFALAIPAIAVAAAGSVELARLSSTSARFQEAADAAALSGALAALDAKLSDSDLKARTRKYAEPLLDSHDRDGAKVLVSVQRGKEPRVTVEISQSVELMFGKLLPLKASTVRRTSTAVAESSLPVCLLVLEPNGADAWTMQGTPDLVAPDCIVQVNSKSSDAVSSTGNASAVTRETRIVAKSGDGNDPDIKPAPKFGQSTLVDPFASTLKWPSPSTCDHFDGQVKKASRTLTPGVYCGGIGAETHGELTLKPGLYVIQTGGLSLDSGGKIRAPDGVTIVLIDPTGAVNIGSKGSLEIEAPKTGPWAGLAVAVKPQPTRRTSNMQGGGEMVLDGVIYLPSQTLHLTGGGEMNAELTRRLFVVNSLQMNGNGQIRMKGDPALLSATGSVRLIH